jgi:starch-binding outer membrane protein SusE/F
MKMYSKYLFAGGLLILAACTKMTNPNYSNGTAPVLTASVKTVAPSVGDSSKNVITFSWTNPKYATDSANEKYTIEIDSSGRNFSRAISFVVAGATADSFTAKQINTIALGFGFPYNKANNMDVRLMSSYANNNEQLMSNTITLSVTPYVTPPNVQPPASKQLFLVGSATGGMWANPVPVPSQQFERVDSVDYAGVFNLSGGNQYLLLPVNGDWTNKYAVANGNVPATGGTFGYNGGNGAFNTNFNGPASAGWYEIWVNFQAGTYTVTPYDSNQIVPDSLFLVGNATAWGWNNPVPEPGQVFTRLNSTQFTLTVPMVAAGQYLFLPVNGSWTAKFGAAARNLPASGGSFGYDNNGSNNNKYGSNFNGPSTAGTYTITADFLTGNFSVTP